MSAGPPKLVKICFFNIFCTEKMKKKEKVRKWIQNLAKKCVFEIAPERWSRTFVSKMCFYLWKFVLNLYIIPFHRTLQQANKVEHFILISSNGCISRPAIGCSSYKNILSQYKVYCITSLREIIVMPSDDNVIKGLCKTQRDDFFKLNN